MPAYTLLARDGCRVHAVTKVATGVAAAVNKTRQKFRAGLPTHTQATPFIRDMCNVAFAIHTHAAPSF